VCAQPEKASIWPVMLTPSLAEVGQTPGRPAAGFGERLLPVQAVRRGGRCIPANTVIGGRSDIAVSIGTISASQIAASGSGRRRPRDRAFGKEGWDRHPVGCQLALNSARLSRVCLTKGHVDPRLLVVDGSAG
jgi:hypothetical protein